MSPHVQAARNYTHHRHLLLLLSPKADIHFTVPQRVEGWVASRPSWLVTYPRWFTRPQADKPYRSHNYALALSNARAVYVFWCWKHLRWIILLSGMLTFETTNQRAITVDINARTLLSRSAFLVGKVFCWSTAFTRCMDHTDPQVREETENRG